jgi:purine-nucleoside phosphorylase
VTVLDDISAAVGQLQPYLTYLRPELAVVLGSGLSGVPVGMQVDVSLPLARLPGFPESGVPGHAATVTTGRLHGRNLLLFQGRFHLYEGYSAWQVTAQVRLAAALGCQKVLLTNAAGGISPDMTPGDFMLITDHLNLTGHNPMRGRSEREFVDLSRLYSYHYFSTLRDELANQSIRLHAGVLAWMTGPSYETPAEINFLENAGAAAVSMSTIPEAIVARRYGMEVSALSLIANPAAGRGDKSLDHQDVLVVGSTSLTRFHLVLAGILRLWC